MTCPYPPETSAHCCFGCRRRGRFAWTSSSRHGAPLGPCCPSAKPWWRSCQVRPAGCCCQCTGCAFRVVSQGTALLTRFPACRCLLLWCLPAANSAHGSPRHPLLHLNRCCQLSTAARAQSPITADSAPDSPLNCDAGNLLRGGDLRGYNSLARMYTFELAQPRKR